MIDTECVISLETVRQPTVDALGFELLLEKRFVAGMERV
jgi:hypothetical protein